MRPELSDIPLGHFGIARAIQLQWPKEAKALMDDYGNISENIIRIADIKELKEQISELALLVNDDEREISAIYVKLIQDNLAREMMFSETAISWLKSKNRLATWTLLSERSLEGDSLQSGIDYARNLLLITLKNNSGWNEASRLKQMMLQLDPRFNEQNLGYSRFKSFLQAQKDIVLGSHSQNP